MPQVFEGNLDAKGLRFALVVSRYNDVICNRLLEGALDGLRRTGAEDGNLTIVRVPGSFELPLVAKRLALQKKHDAVICLGALIRGETTHDQHINRQVSLSLGRTAVETGVPVLFGVLTCNSLEQAIHRAGGNVGNKGIECAEAALEMASLLKKLP